MRPAAPRTRPRTGAWTVAVVLVLAACTGVRDDAPGSAPDPPTGPRVPPTVPIAPPNPPAPAPIDPASVGADELGAVPVLMYHRVVDDPRSDYDITPEAFRAELTWLLDHGYRPVRASDVARGTIDVPAGTTPVVLTFDDSTTSQARLGPDGRIDPDSAIGILLDVAAAHPDVEPVASLYVIASAPFGGGEAGAAVVAALVDLGMELGNHSFDHPDLSRVGPDEVQRQLTLGATTLLDLGAPEVVTLALPFGVRPADPALAVAGAHDGAAYRHELVLLVGAGPAPSPFAAAFDPTAVPRIRTSPAWSGGDPDYGSRFWLEWLDAAPGRRYVSDGDPTRVSFPAARLGDLDPAYADRAAPY